VYSYAFIDNTVLFNVGFICGAKWQREIQFTTGFKSVEHLAQVCCLYSFFDLFMLFCELPLFVLDVSLLSRGAGAGAFALAFLLGAFELGALAFAVGAGAFAVGAFSIGAGAFAIGAFGIGAFVVLSPSSLLSSPILLHEPHSHPNQ
jgi:hypothetical protein